MNRNSHPLNTNFGTNNDIRFCRFLKVTCSMGDVEGIAVMEFFNCYITTDVFEGKSNEDKAHAIVLVVLHVPVLFSIYKRLMDFL